MAIRTARPDDAPGIAALMRADLKLFRRKFPKKMMQQFEEHAREENLRNEIKDPRVIGFVAVDQRTMIGFIAGAEQDAETAMIQYVTARNS